MVQRVVPPPVLLIFHRPILLCVLYVLVSPLSLSSLGSYMRDLKTIHPNEFPCTSDKCTSTCQSLAVFPCRIILTANYGSLLTFYSTACVYCRRSHMTCDDGNDDYFLCSAVARSPLLPAVERVAGACLAGENRKQRCGLLPRAWLKCVYLKGRHAIELTVVQERRFEFQLLTHNCLDRLFGSFL